MKNWVISLLIASVLIPAVEAQDPLFGHLSPKLANFLKSRPEAFSALTNSLRQSFETQSWQLYYFYSEDPSSPRAYHFYPGHNSVSIAVRENQEPVDEYSCLIFEIRNAANSPRFTELFEKAQRNAIERDDFIRTMTLIEFQAVKQTRDILKGVSLSAQEQKQSYYYDRFLKSPDDFDEFLIYRETTRTPEMDAKKHRGEIYDQLRLANENETKPAD